jgi:hypothetical protein
MTKQGRDITLDGVKKSHGLTIGELLDYVYKHNISRDAKILVQRIEDTYFENHNWETVKKEGEHYHKLKQWNEDIDSGKYLDIEKYPLIKEENLIKATEQELQESKEEFYIVHCPVKYDGDDNIYIHGHY